MKKAYLASGWFSTVQERGRQICLEALNKCSVRFYNPHDDIVPADAGGSWQERVFAANLTEIESADFLVVNTAEKDMGTIFEAGYAHASGVPIIYFCEGLKGNFNLMLSRSGIAVATNLEELVEHISGFLKNDEYYVEYKGEIE